MDQVSRRYAEVQPPRPRAAASALVPPIASGDLIQHARRLIARTGFTLLLIERSLRPDGISIRIDAVAADGTRSNGIARSGDPTMRGLCHAANGTLRQLAERQTGSPVVARIGLMTDGTGMLFSPDRLSVRRGDWLGAVLTGEVSATILVPFAATGHWARLAALQHYGGRH